MNSKNSRVLLLALLTIVMHAVGGNAQTPRASCYVLCDLRKLQELGGDLKKLEGQISGLCAECLRLRKNFPYWTFQPGDGTAYPLLKVSVENEGPQWVLRASLALNVHDERPPWLGVLLQPGEIRQYGGLPADKELVQLIVDRFESNVVQANKGKIVETLEGSIPVLSVSPSDVRIISRVPVLAALPLSWEQYCDVANSKFMIKCRSTGASVEIYSEGTGDPFVDPKSNSIYGIVVEYQTWKAEKIEQHLNDLDKLIPVAIYVKELNSWGLERCSQPERAPVPDRVH
jgi:hypothetical protein